MPLTGQQFIDDPLNKGFWWIAAQLGASEFQIAEVTGFPAMEIRKANRNTGQLLAFPYHDTRGTKSLTLQAVYELYLRWMQDHNNTGDLSQPITLNHFRLITDPYLKHDSE